MIFIFTIIVMFLMVVYMVMMGDVMVKVLLLISVETLRVVLELGSEMEES